MEQHTDTLVPLLTSLEKALMGAEIVVIPAGVPRKPGMT